MSCRLYHAGEGESHGPVLGKKGGSGSGRTVTLVLARIRQHEPGIRGRCRGDLELPIFYPSCTRNLRLGCEEVLALNNLSRKGTVWEGGGSGCGRQELPLPVCGRGSLNPACRNQE